MSNLINKTHVRRYLLDRAAAKRSYPFTRVGKEAFEKLESSLRILCERLIDEQPSKGRTIK